MITVAEARARILALLTPLPAEPVALRDAAGRVLAEDIVARRDQPPFAASAMDGYAVSDADARPGDQFDVIGEAAAGAGFSGSVTPGEAVRIFTGAPVPAGAHRVVMQEDVTRDGNRITLTDALDAGMNIRPAGGDFKCGDRITAPLRLGPAQLALTAAMNTPVVQVARRPVVAIMATGDELVMPGEPPGPDQIIASNSFALRAMCEAEGAEVRLLPIARDTRESLETAFDLARGADLLLTSGGASVGAHDLVGPVAEALGMERAFYKVLMRPGKPLMAGKLGDMVVVGLPGNPVASIVCAQIFILPALRAMQGLSGDAPPEDTAPLAAPVGPNGPREHYMRAQLGPEGVEIFDRQDSSLLSVLGAANVLVRRDAHDRARAAGETVRILHI
ncbi:MAG: molybdopterin molybdenumtransferase MoeA [Confluentimicrobium sp.]|nr:molybdopterin molybdenumtransferase MoeA [Actibacterium sp.]